MEVNLLAQSLFLIRNYDLKEAHFGATAERVRDRFKELQRSAPEELSEWRWGHHDIECVSLGHFALKPLAQFKLNSAIRRFKRDCAGWKVV